MSASEIYFAFIRGINVTGHNTVKMAELRQILSERGFDRVQTVLASGNIALEADSGIRRIEKLEDEIAGILREGFSVDTTLQVVPRRDVEDLVRQLEEPDQPENATIFLSFFRTVAPARSAVPAPAGRAVNGGTDSAIPAVPVPADGGPDFTILRIAPRMMASRLVRRKPGETVDYMAVLDRHFGKTVTTRNLNTVKKLLAKTAV